MHHRLGISGLGSAGVRQEHRRDDRMVHVVVLFPYFLYAWTIWHLSRLLRSEDCYNEICPGLYVGRRAFASELPKDVRAVADLTAEFAEPREVRDGRRYLCLPTLDASVPPETEFREFVQAILSESGPTYLHCAEGHGRSGMVGRGAARVQGAGDRPRRRRGAVTRGTPGHSTQPTPGRAGRPSIVNPTSRRHAWTQEDCPPRLH